MIIGIDVSSVIYQTGVSNYTSNLVKKLISLDKNNHYKLFFSSLQLPLPSEISQLKNKKNVTIYHYRLPPTFLQILWNQLHIFPIEFLIGKCDVFHTSDWTQPPTLHAKTIATIHDLTPFLYPQWHHSKVINAHKNKMNWAVKECSKFICVSQSTKSDLTKLFPKINKSKLSVIYEASEEKYKLFHQLPKKIQQQKISSIKNQYGLSDFILVQGTREPRKNLKRLIKAFIKFKKENPKDKTQLAITGKYGWGEDVKTHNSDIKIRGFIPEEDIVSLHAAAICLVYPSLYEGFGLPIVKSLQVGVPVITSNNSSMAEITKGSAILVNPTSIESIKKAIKKITSSPKLRDELSKKGLKITQKFSWQKTAQQTLQIYTSLN